MVKFYVLTSTGYVCIGAVSVVDGKIVVSGNKYRYSDGREVRNGEYVINKAVAKLLPWDNDQNLLLDELVKKYRGTYFKALKSESPQ